MIPVSQCRYHLVFVVSHQSISLSLSLQPQCSPLPYTTLYQPARDAPGISVSPRRAPPTGSRSRTRRRCAPRRNRSEEHTSELQSRPHIVCRLLLDKKNIIIHYIVQLHSKINALNIIQLNLTYS